MMREPITLVGAIRTLRISFHFADAIRPEVRQISDESSRHLEDLVARRLLAHSLASYAVLKDTLNAISASRFA